MNNLKTLRIYSIIIGVFFLISGLGKVVDTSGFALLINQYGFKPLMFLAPIIAILESILGIFLILVIIPKRSALVSLILLVFFTASYAYGYFNNGVEDCGCFGTVEQLKTPPLLSFIRNGILILMTFILWYYYPLQKFKLNTVKTVLVILVSFFSIFSAGLTFNLQYVQNLLSINPKMADSEVSAPLEERLISNHIKTHPDSTYAVMLFSYGCPHCLNSIENLNQYVEKGTFDRVIGVIAKDPIGEEEFLEYFDPEFEMIRVERKEFRELTRRVPVTYLIKNNHIIFEVKSTAPSVLTLKKQGLLEPFKK